MLLIDKNNRTCEIEMQENHSTRPAATHLELDFFANTGCSLTRTDDGDPAYLVNDIFYCIGMAGDWAQYRGDYYDPEVEEMNKDEGTVRHVDVFF